MTWFESGSGRALLEFERSLALAAIQRRPAQPWLWLAPAAAGLPSAAELPGPGICLLANGNGSHQGDVRCRWPLPVPAATLQTLVVQHAVSLGVEEFAAECARVLAPGGRLWLFSMSPCSPQRLRRRQLPGPLPPLWRWRRAMQQAGLYCPLGSESYLGPIWRGSAAHWRSGGFPMRMACLLEVEKRAGAPVQPVPATVHWRQPVATI